MNLIEDIIEKITKNIVNLRFGCVSVELKIHAGQCTSVTYSTTENVKQTILVEKTDKEVFPI